MIHKPKTQGTQKGLGLPNTTRDLKELSNGVAILTEVWNEMEKDWSQDDVIIARPGYKWVSKWQVGKSYVIVRYYTNEDVLIGVYCDVCHPVTKNEGGLEYLDLYLDVWWAAGNGKPVVLDEDELQEALELKYVTEADAEFARATAQELVTKIQNKDQELQF